MIPWILEQIHPLAELSWILCKCTSSIRDQPYINTNSHHHSLDSFSSTRNWTALFVLDVIILWHQGLKILLRKGIQQEWLGESYLPRWSLCVSVGHWGLTISPSENFCSYGHLIKHMTNALGITVLQTWPEVTDLGFENAQFDASTSIALPMTTIMLQGALDKTILNHNLLQEMEPHVQDPRSRRLQGKCACWLHSIGK